MNEIAAQDAVFQQRAVEYQQQILNANKEVEDALISYLKSQEQVKLLLASTKSYKESVRLATLKYKAGETDFNQVFLLQSDLTKVQDQLAQAQGAVATSLIGIYRALGSGWQIRLNQQQSVVEPENLPQPPADNIDLIENNSSEDPRVTVDFSAYSSEMDSPTELTDFVEVGPVARILRNQLIQQDGESIKPPTDIGSPGNGILESTVQIRKVAELIEP